MAQRLPACLQASLGQQRHGILKLILDIMSPPKILKILSQEEILMYMTVLPVCMYMNYVHMSSICEGQRRVSDPLKLEL